jgi:hypothetical protein
MVLCLFWSIVVMGLVGQGVQDGMAGVDKGFEGLMQAVTDTQDNLICSSKLDPSLNVAARGCSTTARNFRADHCEEKSLARFVDQADDLVLELLDDGLAFVSGLSDSILSDMQKVENSTMVLQDQATNMTVLLDQVENEAGTLTGYYPDLNVPNVSKTLIEARKAQVSLNDALESLRSGKQSAVEGVKTQLEDNLKKELDKAKGQISGLLCDTSMDLMGKQNDMTELHDQLSKMRTETATRENMIVAFFCCFTFFGAVLPFFMASIGVFGRGKKCRKGGASLICMLIVCVCAVGGLSQIVYVVLRDVCASRELLITTNLGGQNMSLDGENIVLSEAMLKVLKCEGEETLAGAMGIEKVFDTSDKVDDAFKVIYEAVAELSNSTGSVNDGAGEIELARDQFNRNASSTAYAPGSLQSDIHENKGLCSNLPLNYSSFNNVESCPLAATCTHHATCMNCMGTNSCVVGTKCETRADCTTKATAAEAAAARMDYTLLTLEAEKSRAAMSVVGLLDDLGGTTGTISGIERRVDSLRNNMTKLVGFVKTTPSYSKCAFVGAAYHTIIEEAMCHDIKQSFYQIYGSLGLGVATMFIGFYLLLPWLQAPPPDEGFDDVHGGNPRQQKMQRGSSPAERYAARPIGLDGLGNQLEGLQYAPAIQEEQTQQQQVQRRQAEDQRREQQQLQKGAVRQQQIHQQMMALQQQQPQYQHQYPPQYQQQPHYQQQYQPQHQQPPPMPPPQYRR